MSRNPETVEEILSDAATMLSEGQARAAAEAVFRFGIRCPELSNAYGVCLMRIGENAKALDIYRNLCIDNTGVSLRRDRATLYHVNYATCLLLNRNAAGCESILREINREQDPNVIKLRSAYRRWRATLSWLERIKLSLFGICPDKTVQLDYPPGDLFAPDALKPAA